MIPDEEEVRGSSPRRPTSANTLMTASRQRPLRHWCARPSIPRLDDLAVSVRRSAIGARRRTAVTCAILGRGRTPAMAGEYGRLAASPIGGRRTGWLSTAAP